METLKREVSYLMKKIIFNYKTSHKMVSHFFEL